MESFAFRLATMLLLPALVLLAAGCSRKTVRRARPRRPFWELASRDFPPTTSMRLKLYANHPRLVFRPEKDKGLGRTFSGVRRLYRTDATFKSIFDRALAIPKKRRHPLMLASLWVVTQDDQYARAAVDMMVAGKLHKSGEPYYSQVWAYGMAYDWLFHHPALTEAKRKVIVAKILERLGTELDDLDGEGQALWHGRNQQANGCVIAALAVGDLPEGRPLLRRAAAHYIETLRALEYTQGWPEGASYWIYNRAGPYALGADCVMTALGLERIGGVDVREVMRKIGMWQLYQFTPTKFFEPYGDSSGSLKLGETGWWELSTDHYARLARDPALMAGADYIRNRSPRPYGKRPYYWRIVYTYDPRVRPKKDYDPAKPELWMRGRLPQAMLFGRDSMGVAFFRGKWGDRDECYASFKAGDLLAHHDHYDTGHFSIQRGGLLAPQTGLYGPGGYFGKHRLGYTLQTVSANSLLVLAPGETSAYLADKRRGGKSKWSSLGGGQRVMRPTGFHCVGMAHYQDMRRRGPHLERAAITQFQSAPGEFDYLAADITDAYNSTRWSEPGRRAKVKLVTRQFVYLRKRHAFVVYDRVETTRANYLPKFLLHHLAKPQSATEKLLAGDSPRDGILETRDRKLTTEQNRGRLVHRVLLPGEARALKIGGPNFNCYVETDGDQSNGFDGANLNGGVRYRVRGSSQIGLWRTEVEPTVKSKSTRFLNVLFARLVGGGEPVPRTELVDAGRSAHAVRVGDAVCVFARGTKPLKSFTVRALGARLLLLNAVPGGVYEAFGKRFTASREGLLRVPKLLRSPCTIRLKGSS
jgi:hypothetical protein